MNLPRNGQALLDARQQGEKPRSVVVVSLLPNIGFKNFTLYPNLNDPEGIDWLPVVDLNVDVLASLDVPLNRVISLLADLSDAVPRTLSLSYVEGVRLAIGQSRALPPAQDGTLYRLFDWWPQAIGPTRYADAKKLEIRFRREIGRAFPDRWISTMQLVAERFEQGKAAWQA